MRQTPTIEDIEAALERIAGHAVPTPLISFPVLDAATGGRVLIKAENLQRVGAFKFRGAFNRLSLTDRTRYPGGIVACSSGNHAQGVAEAARLLGLAAVIVMPSDAPRLKIERTREAGAQVILYDRAREDREAIARHESDVRRADFVHPFDDPGVIAGQGTVGLEIAAQALALGMSIDDVLVPCSGGGLASGIAIAMDARMPGASIWTVEPATHDDMARSLAAGTLQHNDNPPPSIADALLVSEPGKLTFEILSRHAAGGLSVSDDEIRAAVRFAFVELKLVVEPGGAAALAAVLSGRLDARGRTVAVVLSGGNVDPQTFADIVTRP
ncbi:MAG: threonine/serine dehydratase [Hyphomicrobiaceae bacterium]